MNLHFTCFVEAPSPPREEGIEVGEDQHRLIELDGRRGGPIDRGSCTDLLQDAAKFIKETYVPLAQSLEFSMLALAPPAV